jgi:hypothetical protein
LDGGTVQEVWGGGTVQKVLDGGTVQEVWGGGTVHVFSSKAKIGEQKAGSVVLDWSGETLVVKTDREVRVEKI